MSKSLFPLNGTVVVLAAAFLAGAGCNSSPPPRDLMAEEARSGGGERPVAMKGEGNFTTANLHVVATVSRGFSHGPGKGGPGPNGSRKGGRKGGFFGPKDTDAYSENQSFDFGDSDEEQKEAVKEYIRQAMARRAAGSPMPPVTLHVTFENRGTTPIEVVPTDVNSDLGNFAVRPPKLTLAPGEKAALDPMISQLGVTNDEIPLTVSIRVGGKTETQVITIKNLITPAMQAQAASKP